MAEFDIRIGTLLDTSKAEQQLQEFINKYQNEDNLKLKLDFSGEGDLKGLEKSLQAIVKFAKSLENIKININTDDVSKIQTNVGDTIKKNTQELGQATQEVKKVVGETVEKNIEGFEERVSNVKKAISMAIEDLQSLKLVENADIGKINELQKQLVEMANIDFDKFGMQGLDLLEEGLQDVNSEYTNLINQARSKQLQNSFNDIKINPLISQMEALKEVMNFKGLDTSGIDNLIAKVRGVSKEGTDLKVASKAVKDVAKDFANMKTALKMTDIKSSETAIKKLLSYREELLKQIPLEIDSSKVEKAEQDIKRIDEAIERLTQNSDKSLVKNLIDLSELKNIENMENTTEVLHKNADKLSNTFEGLKTKFKQLSQTDFVDPTSIKIVEQYIDEIGQSIKSLDFDNIKVGDLKRISDDLETLGVCIDKVKKDSDEIKVEVKFSNDLRQATTELNGLHSALIKLGKDTNIIEKLEDELKGIDKTATQDLKKAGQDLEEFKDKMKNMAQSMGLGDISGEMSQFTKYVNEVVKLTKQLSTTKDLNFADGIKEQINDVMKALNKLTDGFDDVQKEFAQGFLDDAMKGLSQGFTQEIEKINAEAEKLRVVLYRLSTMEMSEGIAKGLAEEFERVADKVSDLQNALKRALSGADSVDASGIVKLREELEQAKQSMVELGKKKIELDCQETIARVEKLRNEVENLDDVLNKLGGVDAISRIKEDFENGAMSVEKATSALKKYNDTLDKVENNSKQIDKSFDAFESAGSKIEGVFNNIKDGFQRFTFGELLEEGIESAIYGIKETILGLDQAMTELKRVAPDSLKFDDVGYKQIANDAREVAMSVGQSTEDVITGMSTALQAGASTMQQATEIARSSAMLQNVSDMDADAASQAIASMVNQYYSMDTALGKVQDKIKGAPKEYNNLTNAIDMINYAGNNWAISTEGVTQALQNGGSVLSSYGVTLSDSIAMISSANESMQDPSRIGNGLRSLAINFAGIKTNAKEGTLEMNKSAKALKEIAGIDIFTDKSKTSVKDMMTLMDEIYDKWDGLTDVQQKGLSEGLAGKTQAAVFQSLMNGWDRVRQFQQEYKEGMMVGSAERENEAYLDSIAGKWNKLKEAMKSLVTNNVSQSFIKGLLDGATKLVQVIEKIMNSLGTIGTGGALLGIASFIKGMASFSKFDGLTGMAKAISTIFTTVKGGSGVFSGIVTGLKSLVTGAGAAKMGMVALNAVLTGLGWAAVVAGIVLAVKALDDYIVTTKEAINAAKDKQQSARDEISSLNSQKSSLSAIAQEYDTLAKKTNKTAEEMDRFRELKQQIAQISPDLVAGYDSNNDPILKLNGSLSSYIGELDVAIAKQQQLFYEGQAEEADARMKDNEKDSVKQNRQNNYVNARDLINNQRDELFNASKLNAFGQTVLANEAKTAEEMAKIRQKYRETQTKYEKQYLEKLSKDRQAINENDLAIQSKYIADFLEISKLSDGQKSMFSGFMEDLNWGTLGEEQADILSSGLEKLSAKTAFVTSDMKGFESQIESAKAKFKDTNAINAYGKSLQEIADKSGKFDLQSWSGYMDEVNTRFENGALNVDQYRYSMGILAETVSELSGIDKGIVLESLVQTGDIESALKVATDGLNNFMKGYGKSVNDLKNGDSLAIELEKQYKAISDLGKTMETKAIEGKFTADFVLEAAKDQDLPSQMREIMNAFARDGEVTEIEQKVLMNIQAEIQDKGKLTGETLRELEDLLNGNFDNLKVDGKIMFNGLELSVEEAEALQQALEHAGMTAESIKMGDTGLENAMEQADAYRKALESINNVEIRTEISKNGLLDTAKEVDTVVKALESIPKEQQVQFISDTAQYFDGAESVQDAINSMPDIVKLKYNIGVEGDTKLTEVKAKIDALPEQVRAEVYAETYNLSEVDKLTQVVNEFGETNATALLTLEGAGEVMHQATSTKEMLQGFQNLVYNSTLEVEVKDQLLQALEKELNELEGKETKTNVTVEEKGAKETKSEVKGVNEEVEKTNGKKATVEVEAKTEQAEEKLDNVSKEVEKTNEEKAEFNVDVNDEAFKVKMKQINDEIENTDTLEANPKVDVEGAEESKQKVEDTNAAIEKYKGTGGTAHLDADNSVANRKILESQKYKEDFTKNAAGNITVNVNGTEKLKVAIGEKGQLEKDGSSVTSITLNGSEQLGVAINEKGQLEVNGVARTDINLNGAKELQLAINDKGELEVNGQAVTDIKVNGKGELEDAKGTLDDLDEEKSVSVSFNVNQALDSILSALGLSSKNETINITVNCIDNASATLTKIGGYTNKTISVTINCTDNATTKVNALANKKIANKTFTVTANASAATTAVNTLTNKKIPNKTFTITCTDSASSKINALASKKIANKTFVVTCKDSASSTLNTVSNKKISNKTFTITCKDEANSKISSVQNKKISNKSFSVSCTDNASRKLSSISSKLSGIRSKTVTVTVKYSQVGKPPSAGGGSASEPQVMKMSTPIIVDNTADVSALASTQSNMANVRNAMASVQASYTDTINNGSWWVSESIVYDLDLLQDFNEQLERVENNLSLVSKQAENAFGSAKANLLQKEISLMQQKQQMLTHEQKELKDMQGNLKILLKSYGFSIDSNGAVTNSVAKLRQLEMAVESAKKKQDAYTGDNKTTQKNLQTAYDNANDKLQRAKDTLSQFYDVSSQIGETANEWEELKQSIEEAKNEITKAKIEQDMFAKELKTQKLENQYDTLADKLELLQGKLDITTNEEERIKLLKEQDDLMDKQQSKLKETEKSYKSQADYYKNFLKQKGFSFDTDGNADPTKLKSLVNNADYEAIKEAYDTYTELTRDVIPDLQKEWYDIQKQEMDAKEEIKELNEQLKETQKEAKELKKIKAFDFLDELIDKQEKLDNQMSLLETKMELVYGDKNKTKALKEQIALIEKQIAAQEKTNKQLEKQRQYLEDDMYNLGFRFDKNNNITNVDSVLNKAKTKEEYEELKEAVEEYYDTQNQIDEGTIAWYEYKNQIAEANKEIEIMQEELKQLKVEANLTQLTNEVTKLANEYDRLETIKDLDGANTLDILNQQIGLLDEQKKATEDLLAFRRKQAEDLKSELSDYGFKFDEEGLVQNASKTIESLKNTLSEDEFEKVNNSLEEYFDVSLNEIDDLEKELLEFEKTYEDIQREKLDATKKIEDEITKIYEKQIEERIEQIEKERDAQVESLNKAKEAYQRYRDEVDYEDSYNEQLSKVQELQAQIEVAKRDDSLSGKKRLEDLMEQLNEEQKTLEDLVQDKIDSDINTMFDDQIENIEKNAEEQMEDLENTFSETKIAEMVANAIQTGIFEDIDGNIVSLDTALMDFANNSTEYLGIMGESLKTELLDNLNIALDTMQQLNNINSELKQGQMTNRAVGVMPIDKSIGEIKNDAMSSQVISRDIAIGDMSITIQGNATPETVEDIRVALNEYIETMKKEIWTNVK